MTDRKDGYKESSLGKLFTLAPATINGKVAIPAAAFDATKPLLMIRNKVGVTARHSIRDLLLRQIGAAAAPVDVACFTDKLDRYVSGGALIAPVFPNQTNGVGAPIAGISEAREAPIVTSSGAPARGTIQAIGGADLIDTETFVLSDGANPALTFEFDLAGGGITGDVAVVFGAGDTPAVVAAAIIAAINGAAPLTITAQLVTGSTTQIELSNQTGGVAGNVAIIETVADAGFVVTGMAGGAAVVTAAALVLADSMAAGDRVSKIFDLAEKAIIDAPGTFLVYVVTGATEDLAYGMDVVNRT
jgi:hypothetical protein